MTYSSESFHGDKRVMDDDYVAGHLEVLVGLEEVVDTVCLLSLICPA